MPGPVDVRGLGRLNEIALVPEVDPSARVRRRAGGALAGPIEVERDEAELVLPLGVVLELLDPSDLDGLDVGERPVLEVAEVGGPAPGAGDVVVGGVEPDGAVWVAHAAPLPRRSEVGARDEVEVRADELFDAGEERPER